MFVVLLLALAIGFFVSRAVVSIATVAIFILAVYYRSKQKTVLHAASEFSKFSLFGGFYVLILFCSVFSRQLDCFTQPLVSFAPLLLLSFAFYSFSDEMPSLKRWVSVVNWIFIWGTLFLMLNMVYQQGFSPTKINQLAQESKNVSNILGVHHNIVGFLAVYAIFYISELLKLNRKPFLIALLLLVIALIHYLGLRFAIMAFYPLLLVYLLRLRINLSIKVYSLFVGCIILIGSFVFIPAFKGRYQNTKADFKTIVTNSNPNFWSLNQRLIANQIGLDIAYKHWPFGVGTCAIKEAVEAEYLQNSRLLIPENRKFIHNQVIYGWATFGIFYVLGWLVLFGFLIYRGTKERSILLEITLLFIMHQMIENTLEKQLMLVLFVYFTFLMPKGLKNFTGGKVLKTI